MQRLQKRLPWLTERNLLILILLFMTAFVVRIATRLALALTAALVFPWGMGKVFQLKRNGDIPKNAPVLCVCAAMLVCILVSIVAGDATLEFVHLFWSMGICALFLMIPPRKMSLRKQNTELFSVGCMFVCLYLPFALLAIYSVFSGKVIRFPSISTPIGIQSPGVVDDRIRIFSNPNSACRFACFNILFSIYAVCRVRNVAGKGFFCLNAVVNTIVLSHTQSRTGFIALAAALAALTFRFVYLHIRKWRVPVGLLAAAIVVLLALEGLDALYLTDVGIAKSIVPTADQTVETLTRSEARGRFDALSSGRGEVWGSIFSYLLEHPRVLITGLGRNAYEIIAESSVNLQMYTHSHSSYLSCLIFGGIPYLLCTVAFLCTLIRPCLTMLLAPATGENRGMFIVPAFIGMMIALSVPEEMLFTNTDYVNYLFYFLCGHALHYYRLQKN